MRCVVSVIDDKEVKELNKIKNIEYSKIDVTDMKSLVDCTFDRVFYIRTLTGMDDKKVVKCLKEAYRMLKEYGLIVVCEEVEKPLRMTMEERTKFVQKEREKFIKREKEKVTTNKLIEKIKEADFLNIESKEMEIGGKLISVIVGDKQGG